MRANANATASKTMLDRISMPTDPPTHQCAALCGGERRVQTFGRAARLPAPAEGSALRSKNHLTYPRLRLATKLGRLIESAFGDLSVIRLASVNLVRCLFKLLR